MISKAEAIIRLKKMGVMVADDQSIVTILLPKGISLTAGIKDIKEKMKSIDYSASFCIKQKSELATGEASTDTYEPQAKEEAEYEADNHEEVTEEELKGSLLSMDDDGQFTLGGFGMDF